MNYRSRIWVCVGLTLVLLASGCATPSLFKNSKQSTAKRSTKKSSSTAKASMGMPAADEIPDAHMVGLSVKGS